MGIVLVQREGESEVCILAGAVVVETQIPEVVHGVIVETVISFIELLVIYIYLTGAICLVCLEVAGELHAVQSLVQGMILSVAESTDVVESFA